MAKYGIPERNGREYAPAVNTDPGIVSELLDVAFSHRISLIASALGTPPAYLDRACQGRGRHRSPRSSGKRTHAERQLAAGVDLLIAQGTEAGGHTGAIATMILTPEIVEIAGDVPVLAAGGIASGRQMAAALALGAAGVWCGSVWLSSEEDIAPAAVKQKFLAATSSDTLRSATRTGKPARQLRSAWHDEWDIPGAPAPLPMPLQSLLVQPASGPHRRRRRSGTRPRARARELLCRPGRRFLRAAAPRRRDHARPRRRLQSAARRARPTGGGADGISRLLPRRRLHERARPARRPPARRPRRRRDSGRAARGSSARRVGRSRRTAILYWEAYAANKRGVTAIWRPTRGGSLRCALRAEADFVFESETPGTMARRGLAYDDVQRVNRARRLHVDHAVRKRRAEGTATPTPSSSSGPRAARWRPIATATAAAPDQRPAGIPACGRRRSRRRAHRASRSEEHRSRAARRRLGCPVRHAGDALADPRHCGRRSAGQRADRGRCRRGSSTRAAAARARPEPSGTCSTATSSCTRARSAAGRFTNNLFRWLHQEGACDAQLAALDWSECRSSSPPNVARRAEHCAASSPSSWRARRSARCSRRRSSVSCSPRRSSRSPTSPRARSSRRELLGRARRPRAAGAVRTRERRRVRVQAAGAEARRAQRRGLRRDPGLSV